MKTISKDSLSSYAEPQDINSYIGAYSCILDIINRCIEPIKQFNVVLSSSDFEIVPINAFSNATATSTSELDLVIASNCIQLEANSVSLVKSKWAFLKKRFFDALKNLRNKSKRRSKNKQKRERKALESQLISENKPYSIEKFKYDFYQEIRKHLSNLSIIYYQDRKLRLVSKNDLQLNVNLFFAIKNGQKYKIWSESQNKFFYINCDKILTKNQSEQAEKGENYTKVFTILNNLYFIINKQQPPTFLVESMMFNIPKELFLNKTVSNAFNSAINYLYNNTNKTIPEESIAEYTDLYTFNEIKSEANSFVRTIIKNLE